MVKVKKLVKLLLILSSIVAIILIIILTKLNKKNEVEPNAEKEIKVVEKRELDVVHNRGDFYTVSACVNMYLSCESSKDKDILINILDESFKEEKNITKSNVLEKIDTSSARRSFSPKKMYYEINKNIRNFLYLWKY